MGYLSLGKEETVCARKERKILRQHFSKNTIQARRKNSAHVLDRRRGSLARATRRQEGGHSPWEPRFVKSTGYG